MTKFIKAKLYKRDNAIRFENGRLFTLRIPFEGGKQSGMPEKIDVTEEVASLIAQYIK